MDSGPNGDSFVAPRMLPDPDEAGDYRWPPSCKTPPEDIEDAVTDPGSRSSHPNTHHSVAMVLLALSYGPETAFRNWYLQRTIHPRRRRELLVAVREAIPV